jgi:lipase chaperone LimK
MRLKYLMLISLVLILSFWSEFIFLCFTDEAPAVRGVIQESPKAKPAAQHSRDVRGQIDVPEKTESIRKLPESFRNTVVDGVFRLDTSGNLIVTDDVRKVFDYFMLTVSDEGLKASVERLRDYVESELPEPARAQVNALLSQYIDYKVGLVEFERAQQVVLNPDSLMERELALKNLRLQFFDEQAYKAFFGFEELHNNYKLNYVKILNDKNYDAQTKQAMINDLRGAVPDELRYLVVTDEQDDLLSELDAINAKEARGENVYEARAQLVGPEAAQRLDELGRQREAWNEKVLEFFRAKEEIESSNGLSDADRREGVRKLVLERFDRAEQLRLGAILEER